MLVSIGRIRLSPANSRLWFLWYGAPAYLQAKWADGAVYTSARREDSHTFWSLSVWVSREGMLAYRNSGSHLRVMRMSQARGARVDFRHWHADVVPTWDDAMRRLTEQIDALANPD
jgi:hypothetical protein